MIKRVIGWALLINIWLWSILELRKILHLNPPDLLMGGMGNGLTAIDFLEWRLGERNSAAGVIIILLGLSALIWVLLIRKKSRDGTSTARKALS
jgi:hypothetical protein